MKNGNTNTILYKKTQNSSTNLFKGKSGKVSGVNPFF